MSITIQPFNHWLYQVACFFFCLSYLQYGIFYLRICLLVATSCLALWCWFILAVSLDGFLWNAFQALINIVMLGQLIYERLPIKFDPLTDEVYSKVFARVCYLFMYAVR